MMTRTGAGVEPSNGEVYSDRLVDVGGYRLAYDVEGTGSPTVIFDSGCGGHSEEWRDVKSQVARFTRVFTWDRAGCGASERGPIPRTSGQVVTELRTLLRRAGIQPPFVMVGHSFGGMNVRLFASRFLEEVAGLILIDSAHEQSGSQFPPEFWDHEQAQLMQLRGTALDEALAIHESSRQLDFARRPLGNIPLVVLAAGSKFQDLPPSLSREEMNAIWRDMQKDLATLSTCGTFRIVESAGHQLHREHPGLVVQTIQDVVAVCRDEG